MAYIPKVPTPVTAWYQKEPVIKKAPVKTTCGFYFNHIEDGHAAEDTPADRFDLKWHKATWQKRFGYLEDQGPGRAPKLVLSTPQDFELKETPDEAEARSLTS